MIDRTAAVQDRVKQLEWQASYTLPEKSYPTKYKIPSRTKDPFRSLVRNYCAMEKEKDDRQYGSITDVVTRLGSVHNADPRWAEIQKIVLPGLFAGEYNASKCAAMLIDTVDNNELRVGYSAQMQDEIRHFNQGTYLVKHWAKHWRDPEAFARIGELKEHNLFFQPIRSAFERFANNDDPIVGSIALQVIAETAFTNPTFIPMTKIPAMNGDNASPTVFLSIQSDEARHMANGYATIAAVLSEPDNVPMLQEDLDDEFWRQAKLFNPFVGVVYDYFHTNRAKDEKSYAELYDQWVGDEWAGAYMARLEPFGLKLPKSFEDHRGYVRHSIHSTAVFEWALWPLWYWRLHELTPADFEHFENKYPGYWAKYGSFFEMYNSMTDPADAMIPIQKFIEAGPLPIICRTCMMAGIYPDVFAANGTPQRIVLKAHGYDGFCSQECEDQFDKAPHRYLHYTPFYTTYDGWNLADIVIAMGLIRQDGKTLLGQPTSRTDRMWTIDDIRRCNITINSPIRQYAEANGVR